MSLRAFKMSDKILIVKYFGQAAPQLMDMAARSLPRASHIVSQGLAAYKRLPATTPLSDDELIGAMFKSHDKRTSEK